MYEYVDVEKYYFSPHGVKTEGDVKRERAVVLMVLGLTVFLAVGIPLLTNIGKALFEIPPIIY